MSRKHYPGRTFSGPLIVEKTPKSPTTVKRERFLENDGKVSTSIAAVGQLAAIESASNATPRDVVHQQGGVTEPEHSTPLRPTKRKREQKPAAIKDVFKTPMPPAISATKNPPKRSRRSASAVMQVKTDDNWDTNKAIDTAIEHAVPIADIELLPIPDTDEQVYIDTINVLLRHENPRLREAASIVVAALPLPFESVKANHDISQNQIDETLSGDVKLSADDMMCIDVWISSSVLVNDPQNSQFSYLKNEPGNTSFELQLSSLLKSGTGFRRTARSYEAPRRVFCQP